MKTINQLVKELGISRQTLYNLIRENGLSIDNLTTEKRGKTRLFDEKSEGIVKELLSKRRAKVVNVKDEFDNLKRDLAGAEARARELAEQLEAQAEELNRLRTEADKLKEDNQILIRTNATNAITIQSLQAERDKLLLSAGAQKEPGRIARAWRILIGKEEKSK